MIRPIKITVALMLTYAALASAVPATCPYPLTLPLQAPWIENPASFGTFEPSASWYSANILTRPIKAGVTCTYKVTDGYYSIWWPEGPTKKKGYWMDDGRTGYVCKTSYNQCQF